MPTSSKKKTSIASKTVGFFGMLKHRYQNFLMRRPHRSFRLTRRRDYVRPLQLPGNISFTFEVTRTLLRFKVTFLLLAVVYIALFLLLVGMQSQDTYSSLSAALKETGGQLFSGDWGAVNQAGILFISIASLGAGAQATEAQQIFSVLIFLLMWLTTVWLLRHFLAGKKVTLRDGLYNAGAPLFAMAVLAVVIVIQLLPVAIAFIAYSAAAASGLLAGGAVAMLFWVGAALLVILSLYWVTSSLFAMIIITLPGTRPFDAIKAAGDIMIGRRIKILLRWVWMALMLTLFWAVIMIPIILLDMWSKSTWPAIQWVPIVPMSIVCMAAVTTVWSSAYVYLLYRKVVDYVPAS